MAYSGRDSSRVSPRLEPKAKLVTAVNAATVTVKPILIFYIIILILNF